MGGVSVSPDPDEAQETGNDASVLEQHQLVRAALVVAHPGHELRVHGFLEAARPRVFVITDGSGHGDRGRIDSTGRLLEQVGACRGSIFGRLTDRHAYRLILEQELDELEGLVRELADELERAEVEMVISDAAEGFNPVHDLCFVLARCAVRLLEARSGTKIRHLGFPLEAPPDAGPGDREAGVLRWRLSDATWQRKMDAAWAYPEMRGEVEKATGNHGSEAFRLEVLRPVAADTDLAELVGDPPFYETHGERRVRQGVYDRVLTFRGHFLPVVEALVARTDAAAAQPRKVPAESAVDTPVAMAVETKVETSAE